MKDIIHMAGKESDAPERLPWQALIEQLGSDRDAGTHRKTFLESLIRFGQEQECCGRKKAAEKIYEQVQTKLGGSSPKVEGVRSTGVYDFSKVTGYLLDQARRNTAEVFKRRLHSFPEQERKYFDNWLGKYNASAIQERNVSEDLSDFRRLRAEISERITRYGARGGHGQGIRPAVTSETAGRYNARYNLRMLAQKIDQSDPLWLRDLYAHYAALARFSSLFS